MNPKLKGKVSTQPYISYFDILSGPKQWGPEPTADYVRKLSGQISGLMRCGEYERVVSGEFPIHVLACGEGGVLPFTEKGAPLKYVIPSDAAMVTHRYCAVPKNGRSRLVLTRYSPGEGATSCGRPSAPSWSWRSS